MYKSARRPLNYANVTATLALVFAMSGGAFAARHYMINSTGQINPKVLKKLKGNKGATGVNGPQGKEGTLGREGAAGKEGKEGAPGKDGAVSGYGAVQTSEVNLAKQATFVQIPGLTKTLSAGSFIVSANVEIHATVVGEAGSAGVECEVLDTPITGSPTAQVGRWISAVDVPALGLGVDIAAGEVPLHLAVATTTMSTLSLRCTEVDELGKEIAIQVNNGVMTAVQTTQNT